MALKSVLLAVGCAAVLQGTALATSPVWSQTNLIFFAEGSAELGKQSEAAFAQCLEDFRSWREIEKIDVFGHADAMEPDGQALSQARGEAVRARLAALGIPGSRILIFARGATQPLVSTDEPEPRNQRAEFRCGR